VPLPRGGGKMRGMENIERAVGAPIHCAIQDRVSRVIRQRVYAGSGGLTIPAYKRIRVARIDFEIENNGVVVMGWRRW
jgi:hypothetical protein